MYKFVCKSSKRAGIVVALALTPFISVANAEPRRAAEDLIVKYDQSELLPLDRPAAQIIIGNPSIADITVKSDKMLVVTGKTFGITNIIVLDGQNKTILSQRVLVRRDEASVVNLQRGTSRQSYNCTPECNPSITIGDDAAFFNGVSSASQNKVGMAERAADNSPGQMPNQPAAEAPPRYRQ